MNHGDLPLAFMPHGMCYLWLPSLIAAVGISNALIALAYFATSGVILLFFRRRPDLAHPLASSLLLFATFFLCAIAHVLKIVTIWWPLYWTAAVVDMMTAVSAVSFVAVIAYLLKDYLRSPTVESYVQARSKEMLEEKNAALEEANRTLERLNADLQQQAVLTERATELLANREERIRDLRTEVGALRDQLAETRS